MQEKQILPTPPVGWPIVWFMDDQNDSKPIAATVTAVEAPGRVSLYYVSLNGFLSHKRGVNWMGDDRRLEQGRPYRVNGCWDFLPDMKPRNAIKFHKDDLARRELAAQRRGKEDADRMYKAKMAHEERKKNSGAM